jgi:hypothetical protein
MVSNTSGTVPRAGTAVETVPVTCIPKTRPVGEKPDAGGKPEFNPPNARLAPLNVTPVSVAVLAHIAHAPAPEVVERTR